jgi:hypothetical protein
VTCEKLPLLAGGTVQRSNIDVPAGGEIKLNVWTPVLLNFEDCGGESMNDPSKRSVDMCQVTAVLGLRAYTLTSVLPVGRFAFVGMGQVTRAEELEEALNTPKGLE